MATGAPALPCPPPVSHIWEIGVCFLEGGRKGGRKGEGAVEVELLPYKVLEECVCLTDLKGCCLVVVVVVVLCFSPAAAAEAVTHKANVGT